MEMLLFPLTVKTTSDNMHRSIGPCDLCAALPSVSKTGNSTEQKAILTAVGRAAYLWNALRPYTGTQSGRLRSWALIARPWMRRRR